MEPFKEITREEAAQVGLEMLKAAPEAFLKKDSDELYIETGLLAAIAVEFLRECEKEICR